MERPENKDYGTEVPGRSRGRGISKRGRALLPLACLVFFSLEGAAHPAGNDLIAGGEWDAHGQTFTYAGAGVSRPLGGDMSLTGRLFAGHLEYNFESEGQTLSARTPIVTVSAGLRYSREWYTLAGSMGPDFRRLSKDTAAGGRETDSQTGAFMQAEAYLWGAGRSAELIANYSTIDSFIWARTRVKKGVYSGPGRDLLAGAEATAMGNSDFSATGLGLLAQLDLSTNFSLLLKGGYRLSTAKDGAYGGVELYYGF